MKLLLLNIIMILLFANSLFAQNPNPSTKSSTKGFIENKGQIIDQDNNPNPEVLYLLNTPGMNVQLRRGGFSYDLYEGVGHRAQSSELRAQGTGSKDEGREMRDEESDNGDPASGIRDPGSGIRHPASVIRFHRIDFNLISSNPNCEILTSESSSGYLNYYTTGTPVEGATFVRSFLKITYRNIYPNVDLEFLVDEEMGFKYNFVIYPGGNLDDILFLITDPEIAVSQPGSLLLKTSLGTLSETIPRSHFCSEGVETPVNVRFIEVDHGVYGLATGEPVPGDATLIIDPVPDRLWGTYYGGPDYDVAFASVADVSGNCYIAGRTASISNIATVGAHQVNIGGSTDGFLAKFTPGGSMIWATYYGGGSNDEFHGMAISPDMKLVVSGTTASGQNIATPGSFQPTLGSVGVSDAFLTKFDTSGVRLWGTYYGGTAQDGGNGCAVDGIGNIYLSGSTLSPDNIATSGSHQPAPSLLTDLFLVKFTPGGNRIWGTYYGGECIDDPGIFSNCAVDGNSHVYICGSTCSLTNISTAGSFQPGTNGGDDGFLVQFDTSGIRQWGTYYGGELDDRINYIKVAPNGRIILAGETQSVTGIASPGAFQTAFGGGNQDAFLGRFYPDGQRHWVTYYGGVEDDAAHAGDIDANGNLYFCGFTKSLTAIATPGVFQPAHGGGVWDAMMMKFDSSGNRLWGSYYGGEGNDWAYGFNYLGMNGLYLSGGTSSLTNVATTGSQQPVYGGGTWDGFLVKFIECLLPDTVSGISGPDTVCKGSIGVVYSIPSMPYASGYFWEVPVGSMITNGQNTQQITVTFGGTTLSGYLSVRGTNNCGMGEPNRLYITVYPSPIPTLTGDDSVCSGQQVTYVTDSGQSQYQWAVSPGGMVINGGTLSDTTITILWLNIGSNWVRVNYLDSNGCFALISSQQNVLVYEANTANISISTLNSQVCSGTFVTFVASSNHGGSNPNFQWEVNSINTGSNDSSFSYYPSDGDTVRCILTSSIQNCISNNPATSNPIVMTVNSLLPVSITISPSINPVCGGFPVTFTGAAMNGGSTPAYQWQVNGTNAGTNSPIFTYVPMTNDQITCVLTSSEPCVSSNPVSSNPVIMNVVEAPEVTFTPCFDTITTINAKPFKLKGGIPLGGTYSGSGTGWTSETGWTFYPATAGPGIHQIT
ncbi:MAG: hypothetical protein IH596_04900, partial [Bacteroidales bacterium]|nr:hypothetical protein [Bacteroidales bacterium]